MSKTSKIKRILTAILAVTMILGNVVAPGTVHATVASQQTGSFSLLQDEGLSQVGYIENLFSTGDYDIKTTNATIQIEPGAVCMMGYHNLGVVKAGFGPKDSSTSVVGKNFRTNITYEELNAAATGHAMFFYGSGATNELKNCVTVYINKSGALVASIWDKNVVGDPIAQYMSDEGFITSGKQILLGIDISEQDASGNSTICISVDGTVVLEGVADTTTYGNTIWMVEDGSRFTATYRNYVQEEPETPVTNVTLAGVNQGETWRTGGGTWQIHVNLNESLDIAADTVLSGMTASFDGGEALPVTVIVMSANSLCLSISGLPDLAGVAGKTLTFSGTAENDDNKIAFAEPITLVGPTDGIVGNWSVQEAPEKELTISSMCDYSFSRTNTGVTLGEANTLYFGYYRSIGYASTGFAALDSTQSATGKSFRTYITYKQYAGSGTGPAILYYGADQNALQDCVTMYVDKNGAVVVSVWGATAGTLVSPVANSQYMSEAGLITEGKEILLEIDVSEPDASGNSTIKVRLDGTEVLSQTANTTGYVNRIGMNEDGAKWTATYRDYAPIAAEKEAVAEAENALNEATEITASDFELTAGAYTEAAIGTLNGSIDGKKLSVKLSDIEGKTADDYVQLDYANLTLRFFADNETVKVYAAGGENELASYSGTAPFATEIYTEYLDLDNDGSKDDMRSLLRLNGTLIELATDGYWLCTNDKPNSETNELKIGSPADEQFAGSLISINDFDLYGATYDVYTPSSLSKGTTATIFGKSFKTYISSSALIAGDNTLYYGLSGAEGIVNKSCIRCFARNNQYYIMAYDNAGAAPIWKLYEGFTAGKDYLLEIDISEQDASGNSTVTIKFDGDLTGSVTMNTSGFANQAYFQNGTTAANLSYKKYSLDSGKRITSFTIGDYIAAKPSAVLEDGVLTISGKGTVTADVLEGVVENPGSVTAIVIGAGIRAVGSGVFNGYTNLKTVTYADSVESVADDAFVGCATGVEVTCPADKEFIGGLADAVIVKVIANISIPETGVVNPPVVVTRADTAEIYNNLRGSAVAIISIDASLNVLDKNGAIIDTVEGFMGKYKNTIVPAFYLDSAAEVTALCTYLQSNNNRDALYMTSSHNAALLLQAKTAWKYARGVLEFDALPTTLAGRGADRREINNNLAMVAVYPSEGLTADIVAEYNVRGISLWSYAEAAGDVYAGISNGVNGLVTSAPSTVISVYESITEKTLTGKPVTIAHRGLNGGSAYPSQTLEIFRESVALGITALEMDIELTKDQELVVIGGDAFKALENEIPEEDRMGFVSAYTLAELKALGVRVRGADGCAIPSLNEVFQAFKNTDVALYLHVNYITDPKGANAEGYIADYEKVMINKLHALVGEIENGGESIADNLVMLSRGADTAMYRGAYGLAVIAGSFLGERPAGYYPEAVLSDPHNYINVLNSELGGLNTQQLPYRYDLVGTDDSLSYRMAARGFLTLQTVNYAETKEDQDKYFINTLGSTAVMTNHPEYTNDYRYQLHATDITCDVGDTISLEIMASTNLEDVQVSCGLIYLSGNILSEEDGSYKATVGGTTEVVYYADITIDRGYGELTYRLYSAPVTITVVANEALAGTNLVLNSTLTLNITADLAGGAAENYTVHVTVGDDKAAQILINPTVKDGKYIYSARLLPHRMHETVTVELVKGNEIKDSIEWTLDTYIGELKETYPDNAELSDLLDALSNYGKYADCYADDAVGNLNIEAVAAVNAENLAYFVHEIKTTNSELKATANLYLDEACDLRFKFNKAAMAGLDLYVDGILCTTEDFGTELVAYTISDILPQDWNKMHTVVVKNGETVVYELSYGVLSYAYQALKQTSSTDSKLSGLLASMYLYSAAANAYIDAENEAQIEISAFQGPPSHGGTYDGVSIDSHWNTNYITEQNFQDYKDAGFTYILSECSAMYGDTWTFSQGTDNMKLYMETAEKVGIPVVVQASAIADYVSGGEDAIKWANLTYNIDGMIEKLSQYSMFKGITMVDEPSYFMAPRIQAVLEYTKALKPDLYQFTCMLPSNATASALSATQTDKEAAYREYANTMGTATGTFAYDRYPLYVNGDTGDTYIKDGYYQNFEWVAQEAKKNGYDTGLIVQSSAWGQVGEENTTHHPRKTSTKADIGFQVYSALAYGAKTITYYTYWEHSQQYSSGYGGWVYDAMVMYPSEENGEPVKTDAYYAVQAINEELKKFDQVFLKYDWVGSMAVAANGKAKSTLLQEVGAYSSPRINSVSATQETLIGCMKDQMGQDGFFLVNATDPGDNTSSRVTVNFKNATSAICYIEGEETEITLTNGSYTFDLGSGEGIFVIPMH